MATVFNGTSGDDFYTQEDNVEVEIRTYGGNDDVYLNRTDDLGGFNYVDAGTGNDYVLNYFEGGNDIFLGDGDDFYSTFRFSGNKGSYDVVKGGNGNDRFRIDTEASKYYGEAGNDTFESLGFDKNYFNGGTGTDTISYEDEYRHGEGVTVDLGAQEATTTSGHVEDLIDIENAIGRRYGDDDITGSSASNILEGLGGSDLLKGLAGADDLYGGTGNDKLKGGSGDDLLVGGTDVDFLTGGTGKDTFDFNSIKESVVGTKRDVIIDFHRSELDVINLATIDANTLKGGNQTFAFIGAQPFHDKAGELRFINGVISGDTNGDGVSDFQIKVSGVTKLYADDFVL